MARPSAATIAAPAGSVSIGVSEDFDVDVQTSNTSSGRGSDGVESRVVVARRPSGSGGRRGKQTPSTAEVEMQVGRSVTEHMPDEALVVVTHARDSLHVKQQSYMQAVMGKRQGIMQDINRKRGV